MSWKVTLALWLLKMDKKQILVVPAMSPELIQSAKTQIDAIKDKDGSGEYKRGQVLRALMNTHPDESESNCARVIELVLCGAVS